MPQWGLSETGWYRPRLAEVRTEIEARWRGNFGANRNTAHDSVDGHFVDMTSEVVALLLEKAEGNYNAAFLDTTFGVALDLWAAGRGFVRRAATSSTVTLRLTGVSTTLVPAGSRARLDDSGEEFETLEDGTIVPGGVDVEAQSVNTGPVAAFFGSGWTPATVIAGWDDCTNLADAVLGDALESDAEFKTRIRQAMQEGGIKLHLLQLAGVETVTIFQNDTDVPDGLYGDTHWVEAMVVGGDDVEIANTVWTWKAEGVQTEGNDSAIETVTGNSNVVFFTRPTPVPIYINLVIAAGEGFATGGTAEQAIAEELATWGNANHSAGQDVAPAMLISRIPAVASGRFSITTLEVDDIDPPVNTGIQAIADRFVATFDTANIDVSIV